MLSVDAVAAISYVVVQVFQQQFHEHFRAIPDTTALFHCRQFALIPSTAVFAVLLKQPKPTLTGIELEQPDFMSLYALANARAQIILANTLFCRRKGQGQQEVEDGDF